LFTFQVAEFEELSKTETELSFRLKQAQLVVQQVCLVYLIIQLHDNNARLETCSSNLTKCQYMYVAFGFFEQNLNPPPGQHLLANKRERPKEIQAN